MYLGDYNKSTLAAALRIATAIRDAADGHRSGAICGLWDDFEADECSADRSLSWRDLTAIRDGLYKEWPHYSGNESYPVPADEELYAMWQDEHDNDDAFESDTYNAARFAYDNCTSKWDGEYGALRRELLDYMIEQLEGAQ